MLKISLLRHSKVAGAAALYGHTDIRPELTDVEAITLGVLKNRAPFDHIYTSPLRRCADLAKSIHQYALAESDNTHHINANYYDDSNRNSDGDSTFEEGVSMMGAFKEMNFGTLDGMSFDDVAEHDLFLPEEDQYWPQLARFWQAPAQYPLPKAETLAEFHQRIIHAWDHFIAELNTVYASKKRDVHVNKYDITNNGQSTQQPSKSDHLHILLVVHGGVIRMILAHILSVDWQQASWFSQLQISHGSITEISVNNRHSMVNFIGLPTHSADS
jgi:alpha-ribazole phosphatase